MTYVPAEYWTERGRTYEDEAKTKGWWDAENEPIFRLLDTLTFDSVLEVGCGFGRVGSAILRHYPHVTYTGIDVSPDMVESAQKRIPSGELIVGDLAAWNIDRKWDLVISVSVLGHILPEDIGPVIGKLRRWARNDLVHVDWDEVGASTTFQYGHDYRAIHGGAIKLEVPYGRQTMYHVRPTMSWQDAFG